MDSVRRNKFQMCKRRAQNETLQEALSMKTFAPAFLMPIRFFPELLTGSQIMSPPAIVLYAYEKVAAVISRTKRLKVC
jgi:hypothetical protein